MIFIIKSIAYQFACEVFYLDFFGYFIIHLHKIDIMIVFFLVKCVYFSPASTSIQATNNWSFFYQAYEV